MDVKSMVYRSTQSLKLHDPNLREEYSKLNFEKNNLKIDVIVLRYEFYWKGKILYVKIIISLIIFFTTLNVQYLQIRMAKPKSNIKFQYLKIVEHYLWPIMGFLCFGNKSMMN